MHRPLEGLLVLDFSQFLAGPVAALRLADMGARVIKIERPGSGELGRQLYLSNCALDGDSTLFHSINRNKQSFAADLKNERDREEVKQLIAKADVMIQNFRPGVIERLGLDYESVRRINPRIVYSAVTGYGSDGPWRDKPGQDLLAQSLSGVAWLNGTSDQPPTPFGLAIADMLAGFYLVQGVLACLVRRGMTGTGGLVETSLLEAMIDVQFEVLTTHLNDGGQLPQRSALAGAHAYLAAPYGMYATADGYLALSMMPVPRLGELLELPALAAFRDPQSWFDQRDAIKRLIADHLRQRTTRAWLDVLEPADVWCAEVLNWKQLLQHEGFRAINMIQRIERAPGLAMDTTRCPIRIDGEILTSPVGAPRVGAHTESIRREFHLKGDESSTTKQ